MPQIPHEKLWQVTRRLPDDYTPYGELVRWEDDDAGYPDCSVGCAFAAWLDGDAGCDWCVCTNPKSHRSGLLTFEHQGCQAFEAEAEPNRDSKPE